MSDFIHLFIGFNILLALFPGYLANSDDLIKSDGEIGRESKGKLKNRIIYRDICFISENSDRNCSN